MTKAPGYHSFLLRLWQTGEGEEQMWRASLEQPGTQERRGFANPDQLFDYLKEIVGGAGERVAVDGGPGPPQARPGKEKKGG